MHRRILLLSLLAASCAPDPRQPPSVGLLRAWLDRLAPELPRLIGIMESKGQITIQARELLSEQVPIFQELAAKLGLAGQDPATVVSEIGTVLDLILVLIPETAPFVPLLVALRKLLIAFLMREPVVAPPPPSQQELEDVKAQIAK